MIRQRKRQGDSTEDREGDKGGIERDRKKHGMEKER